MKILTSIKNFFKPSGTATGRLPPAAPIERKQHFYRITAVDEQGLQSYKGRIVYGYKDGRLFYGFVLNELAHYKWQSVVLAHCTLKQLGGMRASSLNAIYGTPVLGAGHYHG